MEGGQVGKTMEYTFVPLLSRGVSRHFFADQTGKKISRGNLGFLGYYSHGGFAMVPTTGS